MNKKIINERLIKIRKENGLSQRELASMMGVSYLTYNHVENGLSKGNIEFWQKLKMALDISDEDMWHYISEE